MAQKILNLSEQMPALLVHGPRQVGKTTLLLSIAESDRKYVTFDDMSVRELAKTDPKLFLSQFRPPLILDEIQYAPELMPYLKIEIDRAGQSGMYWLTGSQHFLMMKNVSESLAGRIAILSLLGLSQKEINEDISDTDPFLPGERFLGMKNVPDIETVFRQILLGALPVPNVKDDLDLDVFFNSYIQTYLLRDLRELSQIADLSKFLRFLRVTAARTGQLLNYSDLARDVDISIQTAKNWISVLESSMIVYLLQPYHTSYTKRLIKTPRIFFTDTGLCAYLTGWTSTQTLINGAMSGAIFETYVITEILKSFWNTGRRAPLFFYRDKDGKEIDLLIEHDNYLHPVEIKLSATVRRDWTRHFFVIEKLKKPVGTGAVICLTDRNQYVDKQNIAINIGSL